MMNSAATRFERDRFTWVAYALLACFTYLQAILGLLMPFLRRELALSYTLGGLHLSAFAVGMVLAGLFGARALASIGRARVLWCGAVGMALGALLLALGRHVGLTLARALCMGVPGSLMLVTSQATLSERHGALRTLAFAEANVAGGVSAGLAPLLVGGLQQAGLGWRGALYTAAALLLGLLACCRGAPLP